MGIKDPSDPESQLPRQGKNETMFSWREKSTEYEKVILFLTAQVNGMVYLIKIFCGYGGSGTALILYSHTQKNAKSIRSTPDNHRDKVSKLSSASRENPRRDFIKLTI